MDKLHKNIIKKIKVTDSCWVWMAATNKGYGVISKVTYGHYFAHRYTYYTIKGGDRSLTLDHLCRNTACVNPDHLEAVTHQENVRRGEAGKYQVEKWSKPRNCPQGHTMSGDNLYTHYSVRLKRLNRQCKRCKVDLKRIRRSNLRS